MKFNFIVLVCAFCFSNYAYCESMTHAKYQSMKQKALDFEKTLEPQVLSALNLSNGPILRNIFEVCTSLELPTSFEVVAHVNPHGIVENAWSDTQTLFG